MEDLATIKEIYHAALQIPVPEREAFLRESCGNRPELFREVESLLSFDEQAENFIETPPADLAAAIFSRNKNVKLLGRKLNHYQLISVLGAGGMGEVYLAEDAKLGRKVALKLLLTEFSQNLDRRKRFEKEARAVSALNHPNIITIYGIEEAEEFNFIVTELVEGQTLREIIAGKIFSPQETVEIGIQVAGALESAHSVGIIHRDIKPANIMIRRDGLVKVLDFGLAKLVENSSSAERERRGNEDLTRELSPDHQFPIPNDLTKAGAVMGTLNYMSPEQIRGETLDGRTDIFSLGVVIYEMLSRIQPFDAETDEEIYKATLKRAPKPLSELNAEVSPELEQIISRTLAKDPAKRYQTVNDLRLELQKLQQKSGLSNENPTIVFTQPKSKSSGWLLALIPLLLIISATIAYFGFFARSHTAQIESIAVMPFVDESGNADTEYLSDGMTEVLINNLSQLPNVSVKARSSVFRYKGKDFAPKKIASDLNVQVILNGRVLQRGSQITLSLELIDPQTENVIWSESYNRPKTDLVSLQSEIARDVSGKLRAKLSGAEEEKVTKNYTANPEAYRLYLQGRYFWNKRNPENLRKAIDSFNAAANIDPNYALAYVGLADSYALLEEYAGIPAMDCLPQAKEYALRALKIDNQISEAYASLGLIDSYMWRWNEADKEFEKALELNPNYPVARQWYQIQLRNTGQLEKALPEIQKAQELDPLSGIIGVNLGVLRMLRNEPELSIAELKKTIDLDPNWWVGHFWLGMTYLHSGRNQEAAAALEQSAKLSNRTSMSLGALGYVYAITGKRPEALAILKEVENAYAEHKALGLNVASIYAGLGDKDRAFIWLEKDYQARSGQLPSMKWYPPLISLHNDLRYHDLLRQMNLSD